MTSHRPTTRPTTRNFLKTVTWIVVLLLLAYIVYQFYRGWTNPYGTDY